MLDFNEGTTALFAACLSGHIHIIDYLLAHGADVNAPEGKFGISPLMVAALNGFDKVVDFLLTKEKEKEKEKGMEDDDIGIVGKIGSKANIDFDESSGIGEEDGKNAAGDRKENAKPLDVDWQGTDGATALTYAANDGKPLGFEFNFLS